MEEHPSNLSRRPGIAQDRTTELKEAFDWALQILSLLRRLDGVLSATVKSWQSFASAGGDIGYFHDPGTDTSAKSKSIKARHRSLQNINATFRRLVEYQDKIAVLNKDCSDYKETVSRIPWSPRQSWIPKDKKMHWQLGYSWNYVWTSITKKQLTRMNLLQCSHFWYISTNKT